MAQRTTVARQGLVARIRQWFGRAKSDSHERHTLALIGKSALAATVSWVIAYDFLHARSPAFAPFSAVLIMQVTVYQSFVQSLRFVGAVAAGVALQLVLGLLAGPGVVTFVLMTVTALLIGRWRPLGSQGSQVVTAAFFAFSTYVSASTEVERFTQLGQIILLVVLGCGTGVLVNLLILPPMRYRSAEHGIHTLAHSLCDLLSDVHPALREGLLDEERTSHWRQRAAQLGPLSGQAQSAVRTAKESVYLNPRRLFRRHSHHTEFTGYQAVIDALERVTYQVGSMTRSLNQWHSKENPGDFLPHYGDFLAAIAEIMHTFTDLDEDRLHEQAPHLCAAADEARRRHQLLADYAAHSDLPVSDPSHPYGILLAEATRLLDEAQHTCDVLQHEVDTPTR
ncbi:aromatic acid exporter family protein [Amycolatopsis magusensis]|uniref:FUSC family protein n=1 Tax=Amycolatopsis magusensis TaxID=882444 RepID=UPI003C2BE926